MSGLKTYTHLPTTVTAVRVERPFSGVERACPRAHRKSKGSGAFSHFSISNPGNNFGGNAAEGDWVVRLPNATWIALPDEKFRSEFGVEADSNEPLAVPLVHGGEPPF